MDKALVIANFIYQRMNMNERIELNVIECQLDHNVVSMAFRTGETVTVEVVQQTSQPFFE
jgi:hypothetical protein